MSDGSKRRSRRVTFTRNSIVAGVARFLGERALMVTESRHKDRLGLGDGVHELEGEKDIHLRRAILYMLTQDEFGAIVSPDDLLVRFLDSRELWSALRKTKTFDLLDLSRCTLSTKVSAQLSKTLRGNHAPRIINLEGAEFLSGQTLASLLIDANRTSSCEGLNLSSTYEVSGQAPFKVLSGSAEFERSGDGKVHITFSGAFTTVALKEMAPLRTGRGCFYYEVDLSGWCGEASWASARIGWTDTWWVATSFEDGHGAGVGDNLYSWAYDPSQAQIIADSRAEEFGRRCKTGDIIGCYVDLDQKVMYFSVNGQWQKPCGLAFNDFALWKGIVPALSVASARHHVSSVTVNLGPNFTFEPYAQATPISSWLARQKENSFRSALRKISERRSNNSVRSLLLSGLTCLESNQRPHSVTLLCRSFHGVQHLDLSQSKLGDSGCTALCKELVNGVLPSLISLDLSDTGISDRGAGDLAAALVYRKGDLQSLNLSKNLVGISGIVPAGNAEDTVAPPWIDLLGPDSRLLFLDLSANEINDFLGRIAMVQLSENHRLIGLNLASNCLTEDFTDSLQHMLRQNAVLKHLDLSYNSINEGWDIISAALQENVSLQSLDLGSNNLYKEALRDLPAFGTEDGTISKLRRLNLSQGPSSAPACTAAERAGYAQRFMKSLASRSSSRLCVCIDSTLHKQHFMRAFRSGLGGIHELEVTSSTDLLDAMLGAITATSPFTLRKLEIKVSAGDLGMPWAGLCDTLAMEELKSLRVEKLRFCTEEAEKTMSVSGFTSFAESIGRNVGLQELDFVRTPMSLSTMGKLTNALEKHNSIQKLRIQECNLASEQLTPLVGLVAKSNTLTSIAFSQGNDASKTLESLFTFLLSMSIEHRAERCREILLHGTAIDLESFRLTAVGLKLVHSDLAVLTALLKWIHLEVHHRSQGSVDISNTVTIDGLKLEHHTSSTLTLGKGIRFCGQLTLRKWPSAIHFSSNFPWQGIGIHLEDCIEISELPANLSLSTLVVKRCPNLQFLPADMRISTMLVLDGLPLITELPTVIDLLHFEIHHCAHLESIESIQVSETLVLTHCKSLRQLPDILQLEKLVIEHCESLNELGHLRINEHLRIRSTPLRTLPKGLQVSELIIAGCTELYDLPEDLVVRNLFKAKRCPLEAIPSGVRVDTIYIKNMPSLTHILEGVQVREKCSIYSCTNLNSLPSSFFNPSGRQSVSLRNVGPMKLPEGMNVDMCHIVQCSQLETSGSTFKVKRVLRIEQCGMLTIPHGIQVGDLVVYQCLNLISLPSDLVCRGNLRVDSCPSLELLPDVINLRGSLALRKLPSLVELPPNIRVRQSLDICDCTRLVHLPERLRVRILTMEDNPELQVVPESVRVTSSIKITNCSSLDTLPDSVIRHAQSIVVDETSPIGRDFDLEILRARCGALFTLLELDLGDSKGGRPRQHQTLEEAVKFWEDEAHLESHLSLQEVLDSFYHSSVLAFLNLLLRSAEFRRPDLREGLAKRVVELLQTLQDDPDGVREELLSRISDAIDSCSDKPIWALNDMYLITLVINARGDREALRALGKRVMRLQIVREHAAHHPGATQDDVCVYLRYEISLREELDLPVSAVAMLYRSFVNVTEEDINVAKEAALSVTDEQFEQWLVSWPEWERQIRSEVAQTIKYEDLPTDRLSKRLSLRAFSGEPMDQPVIFDRRGPWELPELLDRWIVTGMDFTNVHVEPDVFPNKLHRAIAAWSTESCDSESV